MVRFVLKGIWARKWRLLATAVSIVMGVAFISATGLLSDTLNNSIADLISTSLKGTDSLIRSTSKEITDGGGGDGITDRAPIDASVLDGVRGVEGVRNAEGTVIGGGVALDPNNRRIGSSFGPPTFITNWFDDTALLGASLTEGSPPTKAGEAVIDAETAREKNISVGQSVSLILPSSGTVEPTPYKITGIGGLGENGDKSTGTSSFLLETKTAQQVLGKTGKFDFVAVAAADGVSQEELTDAIRAELPPGTEALTGSAYIEEQKDQLGTAIGGLTTAISVFGWIALFVGAFVIYNTFSIVTALRTRELALLRAVGASRSQVLASMLAEAVGVGVFAGLVGLAVGWLLALASKPLISNLFPVDSIAPLSLAIVAPAMIVAVVVTVLAAIVPALRTTRIPPIAALGEISVDRSALSMARKVFGALFLLGGIALIVAADLDVWDSPNLALGVGGVLLFVAIVVFGPVFAAPLARLIGAPLPAVFGAPGNLARENAARNPKRTITTAVALTIGVALVIVVAVVASSIKSLLDQANELGYASVDLIVDPGGFTLGFPPTLVGQMDQLPEVDEAAGLRLGLVSLLDGKAAKDAQAANGETRDGVPVGDPRAVGGIDPSAFLDLIDLGKRTPADVRLGDDQLLVRDQYAMDNNLKVGDEVRVYSATSFAEKGLVTWRIAGTFERQVGPEDMYVTQDTFAAVARAGGNIDQSIFVRKKPGVDQAQLETAVLSTLKDNPIAGVSTPKDFAAKQTQFLSIFLGVVYGLLLLSIVIAIIGVVNALSLSVWERTREIGLLRAVGMTRAQLRRAVRWESATIAVLGTVLGLAIGMVLAISFVNGIGDAQIKPVIPWTTIVVVLILSLVAGMAAALWPAWRASEKDVLEAIATE